uniref:Uncharacterized protein n=1 Tax=Mimivirus LCMiAC01 TaxID=2506608 RepID=A0A481YZ94_9VIRU|nr:MAG: hypothetical protein LCMiAC01_02050 [Mimivirus LCMiAC01]
MLKNIHNTNINFTNRIIKKPKFTSHIPTNIKLKDIVLVYNDGKVWKIVPIKILLRYPIIYDKYYDMIRTKNGKYIISTISITYCPYTSCGLIYFGKYVPTGEVYNNNIILTNKKNQSSEIMAQMIGTLYSRKTNKPVPGVIRREETKIMTLRNALGKYPDCMYLHKTSNSDIKPIVGMDYIKKDKIYYPITNESIRYHPKTIVYGIEYIKDAQDKYSVIVGDDATKNKSGGQDYKKAKYDLYFEKKIEDIRDRSGIIIPVYWFAWYSMHPKARVVKL